MTTWVFRVLVAVLLAAIVFALWRAVAAFGLGTSCEAWSASDHGLDGESLTGPFVAGKDLAGVFHTHTVDLDGGSGTTSFDAGHTHTVTNGVVSCDFGHSHNLVAANS